MSVIAATRPKGEEAEECRSRGSHELRKDAEEEGGDLQPTRSADDPLAGCGTHDHRRNRPPASEGAGGPGGTSANKAARSGSVASVFKPGKGVGGVLLGPDDRVEHLDDASPLDDQRQTFVERPAGGGERRQPERGRQPPLRV
jgi:hypothetical protein